MARAQMVTRELNGTEAEVLAVDTSKQTTATVVLTIHGKKYVSNDALLKALKKIYETDTLKLVKIVSTKNVHKLYGMACDEFYKNATELDTETRKPLVK